MKTNTTALTRQHRSSPPSPVRSRPTRVSVETATLSEAHARSLASFLEAHVDPRISVSIERDPELARDYPAFRQEVFAMRISVPGAWVILPLPAPHEARFTEIYPFGSRAWAFTEAFELLRFNEAFQAGRIGHHIFEGRFAGLGGELVRAAALNAHQRRAPE